MNELESAEIGYWRSIYELTDPEKSKKLGLEVLDVQGLTVFVASNLDILAFNRVMGFKDNPDVDEKLIEELIGIYRKKNVPRFFIQIPPHCLTSDLKLTLEDLNFEHYNNWSKYRKEIRETERIEHSNLSFHELMPDEEDLFGEMMQRGFEHEGEVNFIYADAVKDPNWKFYLVRGEMGDPIAGGALHLFGNIVSLALAATIPEGRGKGAQTGLILRRINDGFNAGCRIAHVDTAEDLPEKPSQSARNMERLGFTLAYKRPNYLYIVN